MSNLLHGCDGVSVSQTETPSFVVDRPPSPQRMPAYAIVPPWGTCEQHIEVIVPVMPVMPGVFPVLYPLFVTFVSAIFPRVGGNHYRHYRHYRRAHLCSCQTSSTYQSPVRLRS